MKNKIKKIGIIFFVLLFILTFFSNTIMNYSVPRVTVQSISSGKITSKIRGTGIVESDDVYDVKYEYDREVDKIVIRLGQHVEAGEVLCYLKEADDAVLKTARRELLSIKSEYEKVKNEYFLKLLSTEYFDSIDNQAEYTERVNRLHSEIDALALEMESYSDLIDQFEKMRGAVNRQLDIQPIEGDYIWNDYLAYMNAKRNYNDKNIAYIKATNAYNAADYELQNDCDDKELIERKNETLRDKNLAMLARDNAEYEMMCAKKKLEDAELALNELLQSIEKEIDTHTDSLRQKEEELKNKNDELDEMLQKVANTIEISELENEMEILKLDIESKQQDILEKENAIAANQIESPIAGTIVSVTAKSGHKILADGIIASIHPDDGRYCFYITVTKAQAELVSVGDEATLLNDWEYRDAKAIVSNIVPNEEETSKKMDIIFEVTGSDISLDQSISVLVGSKNESYDFVVPNNAIREDVEGKFIYIIDDVSTPLGTRYFSRRVDVEILAVGEYQSAISAQLTGKEYVITSSAMQLEDNGQIRLVQ